MRYIRSVHFTGASMHRHLSVLGRILICAIFLASAFGKVTDFDGTREMMVSKGVPQANWMLMGAIVFEVVGGLCVLLGFKVWGCFEFEPFQAFSFVGVVETLDHLR
jgi:putative oxidoreductase